MTGAPPFGLARTIPTAALGGAILGLALAMTEREIGTGQAGAHARPYASARRAEA